jgi:radical SAM superfamily enzyme YgiQ (UPF0313 family)
MKIALINPRSSFLSLNPEFNEFWSKSKYTSTYRQNWSGIGTGLLIIASLTPPTYEIELIDENIEDIDFSKNYDLVGITAMTQQATRAYQIADEFRKNKIKVVIGGIHATVLPEEAMGHADSVVVGEAEYLWPQLIGDLLKNELKSYYKNSKQVKMIDSPIPNYQLIKNKKYCVCWVQTTRGCPHNCEFCAASNVYGKKYRHKSIDQIVEEIKAIKRYLGLIRIGFGDDNIFADKKYARELLDKLRLLNIRWAAQTDVSVAEDKNLLKMLKECGCTFLFIGFESLSEESLRKVDNANGWKSKKILNYKKYIREIQSHGIGIMGSFIIGLDADRCTVFKEIRDFIADNNLYDAQVSIATPLPGTLFRKKMEKDNRLLPTAWDNYTGFDVNIMHCKMNKNELESGLLYIYKEINNKDIYVRKLEYFKKVQKKLIGNN